MSQFRGWPTEAIEYYQGLELDNSKSYFTENKQTYTDAVKRPFELLSAEVTENYGPLHIFRPHKDMRFAHGQPPYKTHQGAVTEGEGGEVYYVHLSATGMMIGSGYHYMAKDQLVRFRVAIDNDETGEELVKIVKLAERAGYEISGSALKTGPRGYPKDHPRIRFLRHKGITISKSFEPDSWLASRRVLGRITKGWDGANALNEWLGTHVGPTTEPPREMR